MENDSSDYGQGNTNGACTCLVNAETHKNSGMDKHGQLLKLILVCKALEDCLVSTHAAWSKLVLLEQHRRSLHESGLVSPRTSQQDQHL